MSTKQDRNPRQMRLLQVLEPSGGGSGRHFIDLCRGMQARGHIVHAIYSPLRAEERFVEELQSLALAGTHIVAMTRSPGPSDLNAWRAIRAVMRRAGPFDIVHGHSSKAGALSRLRLPGRHIPRVYTPHAFRTMDPGLGNLGRKVYGSIEKLLARGFTDKLICVSADEYAHARALGMPRDKLSIVVNGVETPPDHARESVRQALGIPDDALLFGFVGRLCHQKAPERLVAAFQLLAGRVPNAHLVMIGSGEAERAVAKQVEASDHAPRIRLTTGFTGPQAMAAIDVLVMPSRYEAMSYVMLEAAAAGKPLILTDVGGASMVLKDGENGVLVENDDDPKRLAGAMLRLSDPDRLARHSAAARARSGDYSLARMISETEAVYRGLIA
ncbi:MULTISPECIES: glycosyltransferase [Shinella]|uniref:Glycosyltransferase n=1 Tax=Shinella lacus TaxID=2654216 RepID=A0ABT1RAU5_9HYPH|nr:glycosyltransferase [Shinella lacus]MCQ4632285.1 glycosyltransferase [Shinella lacus]